MNLTNKRAKDTPTLFKLHDYQYTPNSNITLKHDSQFFIVPPEIQV